jgi:hypothetical protein
MSVRILAAILLTLAVPASAQKPVPVTGPLSTAKGLLCSFPSFGTARWGEAAPQVITGSQDFSFRVEGIDYKNKRAIIVANGNALASLLLTPTGMNIIEQTPIGNVTLTTVFSGGSRGQTFLAVHARHLGELDGPPRASQAFGSCQLQ